MNEPARAGSNQPPGMAWFADETAQTISDWMKEHPVIESEDTARIAKAFIDRGKLCLQDLEHERDKQVRPLNEKVAEINGRYRQPRSLLQRVLDEVEARVTAFLRGEENKRLAAAAEARRKLEEAEAAAREAERLEQERLSNAAAGELNVDIAGAAREADRAFGEFERAERQALVAERETKVKIGGGFRRSLSLKTKEQLFITDAHAAIQSVGVTADITEAILKAARAYRKIHDQLPPGVEATEERTV